MSSVAIGIAIWDSRGRGSSSPMSGYTDLDAPPRRGVHRVVGFGAGAALLFLGFAASRNEWHFLEEELKEKRGMHAAAAEPTTSVVTLNSTDFTAIEAVCEHVAKMEGVGDCRDLDDDTLWRYLSLIHI